MSRLVHACALLCVLAGACDWKPVARPVKPERVLEGNYRIEGVLDPNDRYVLVMRLDTSPPHLAILDLRRRESCPLPNDVIAADVVLSAPEGADDDVPILYLSLQRKASKSAAPQLWLTDPDCMLEGPFGAIADRSYALAIDDDKRGIALWGDGAGQLSKLDPWNDEQLVIAKSVTKFSSVARPLRGNTPIGEQALWLIEGGKLVQRALDGRPIVRLGKNVQTYTQATFDTVHVAFVDGTDVYEAGAPSYRPQLIANDACAPLYQGTNLNLFSPCEQRQLVRLDLTTGGIELFEKGVFWAFSQGGVDLEYATDADGNELLFVTAPSGERTLITPTLTSVQVLDATHVAGRAPDSSFGVWTLGQGYAPLFFEVRDLSPFIDVRTNTFLWLMLHEVDDNDIGRLSVFSQDTFNLELLAEGVPKNGYSVEYLAQIPEPIVVSVEHVKQEPSTKRFRGQLHARFLSGELASQIDDDVISYLLIATPLPGLLYTIDSGPRRGLWFAAL